MPTGEKKQIFYQDATTKLVLRDRISVSSSVADGEVILTIDNVQLQDELEFICEIKDLVGGKAEGSTKLRVFGKIETDIVFSFISFKLLHLILFHSFYTSSTLYVFTSKSFIPSPINLLSAAADFAVLHVILQPSTSHTVSHFKN